MAWSSCQSHCVFGGRGAEVAGVELHAEPVARELGEARRSRSRQRGIASLAEAICLRIMSRIISRGFLPSRISCRAP